MVTSDEVALSEVSAGELASRGVSDRSSEC